MRLGNMTPSFALQYISHVARADTVFSGKHWRSNALSMALACFDNLPLREFCTWVIRPMRMTALFYHICRVVDVRAKEMMRWIAARWVIAFVADKLPVGNGAMRQFICNAMSQEGLTAGTNMDSSVAVGIRAALPFPTIIGAKSLNLQPESVGNGAKASIVPMNKPNWFALDMTASVFVSYCNDCLFATTTVAITVWDFVRGIMGLHKNLQFLCQAQDAANVAGQLLLVRTPVSIAQVTP